MKWEVKTIDQEKSTKLLKTSQGVCFIGGGYTCQVEPKKEDLITRILRRRLEMKNKGESVLQPTVEWSSHKLRRCTCTEGILVLDEQLPFIGRSSHSRKTKLSDRRLDPV